MFKKLAFPIVAALCALAAFMPPAIAQMQQGYRATMIPIVTDATTTGSKTAVRNVNVPKTYEFYGSTSSGTGTAVIGIEGSNALTSWVTVGTTTLTLGTVTTSVGLASTDRWTWLRAFVTSISGTGAKVSADLSY